MKNKLKNQLLKTSQIFVFVGLILSAHLAQSQTGAGWTAQPTTEGSSTRSGATSATSGATGGTTTGTTAGAQYIVPGQGGGSAADSGRRTQNTQLISAAVNVGAAYMYMGICTGCSSGGGCWACPLIPLASTAASMLGNASGRSGSAGAAMSAYDPSMYPGGFPGQVDPNGNPIAGADGGAGGPSAQAGGGGLPDGTTPQTIARDVSRIRSEMERAGVQISPDGKTMKTPDGRTFNLGQGAGDGTLQGLMAMGMTASEAGQALNAGKQYAAKANAKYAGMAKLMADGSGGGGGGRGPASEAGGAAFNWNGKFGQDPRDRVRAKAQVSGLTKKLGDDTIGVSGDDIFEMVTRRYKARDQVNQFLKD